MRPKCFTAASAIACIAAASATSPMLTRALPPAASISRATASASARFAARIDHNGRAAFRQRQRDRAADIATGSGDDGDLADEFVIARHALPSFRHRPRKRTIQ